MTGRDLPRAPRRTHCEKVLALLADGQWHPHLELYRLGTVAHSRVAEIRRRGHRIDCRRDGDMYLYRLVTVRGEGVRAPESAGVPEAPRCLDQPRRGPGGTQAVAPSPGPVQLELTAA